MAANFRSTVSNWSFYELIFWALHEKLSLLVTLTLRMLTLEMLTVCGQQHSYSTHRMFLWKCRRFRESRCLDWGVGLEPLLRWTPPNSIDDKTTLVQVMAWCRQASSHYLNQCWPRSMSLQWFDLHIIVRYLNEKTNLWTTIKSTGYRHSLTVWYKILFNECLGAEWKLVDP